MSSESMVSAEHYRALQEERDGLVAQVERMRAAIRSWLPLAVPDAVTEAFLQEHPEQSLAHIQAAELRRVLALKNNGTYPDLRDVIAGEAYQREQEAQR